MALVSSKATLVVASTISLQLFRLHRMHEMQTIVTDVHSVSLSVTWLNSASLCRVIRCSFCQITLASYDSILAKLYLWTLC